MNDIQDIRTTTNIGRFASFVNPESKVDIYDGIKFTQPQTIMDTMYPLQNRGPAPQILIDDQDFIGRPSAAKMSLRSFNPGSFADQDTVYNDIGRGLQPSSPIREIDEQIEKLKEIKRNL